MSAHDEKSVAAEIAGQLGETEAKPFSQIVSIVKHCGADFARALLQETLEIEAAGGMMVRSGDRRRTPGGIYFYLARQRVPFEIREAIFFPWYAEARRQAAAEAQYPPFIWQDRMQVLQEVLSHKGEVSEVKVQLVGRPGTLDRRQNLVILSMEASFDEDSVLPTGVPRPAPTPMTYVVYVSARQWENVAEAINAPDDQLMIDGLCAYDAETGGMAIFTTRITTQKLKKQMEKSEKREIRKADGAGGKRKQPRGTRPTVPAAQNKPAPAADPEPAPRAAPTRVLPPGVELPPNLPIEITQKLIDLYAAAATFKQRIESISAKPVDQQYGLEMTLKLLKNTERQIDALLQQYVSEI